MACLAVLELTLHPQALLGWHNPSTGQSSLSPLGGRSEVRGAPLQFCYTLEYLACSNIISVFVCYIIGIQLAVLPIQLTVVALRQLCLISATHLVFSSLCFL